MSSRPPPGFIHLILLRQKNMFYLEIPSATVATLCSRPLKYLRYLGWCVLGIIGNVSDEQGNVIDLDGKLVDRGVYHYIVPDQNVLAHAVDLEVIKQRSQVSSETTETPEEFSAKLLERDGCCVWTGGDGIGTYIIPYQRGNEWLQRIVDNRPHDENLDSLTISDIRNGIYADNTLHAHHFNPREVVVLKTPNPILETTDVPERCQRYIATDVSYPKGCRYTLQWLVTPRRAILNRYPNNNDATFINEQLPKPADVLLHYNYGAAAVKQYGKNISVLSNRPGVPRPTAPPTRVKNTIQKRAAATSKRECIDGASAGLDVEDKWDEDDIMLFFWGNTKAARERHAQKEEAQTAYLENWRAAVVGIPDTV